MKKVSHILFFLSLIVFSFFSCKNKEGDDARERKYNKKIVETGELVAVNSKAFVLERYGRRLGEMRIIGILEHGTILQPGDSIIQLDPTDIQKSVLDWESNLETQFANLEKLRVDQDIRRNDLISNIKNEEASFELKKLELEASRFESERAIKIKELEFEQGKIRLAKEKRKLELYDVIAGCDMRIQRIWVQQLENQINNAKEILPNLTLRTPIGGVFQIGNNWRSQGALIKVGDNIYSGTTMANVPDLAWMKVNTYINETDFLDIRLGQKVRVRLDALPELSFDGEVSYIGKLCHLKDNNGRSRQKVFDVEIRIIESDERLKPGMTVSCEYL